MAGRTNSARAASQDRLDVNGRRPAVARVAALPRSYRLTDAEWRVLWVLACDSYDGETCAPGFENLTRWTGLMHSSVSSAIERLCKPTEHRPALLEYIWRSNGKTRSEYGLLLPRDDEEAEALARVVGEAAQLSGELSGEQSSDSGESNSPGNSPVNSPVIPALPTDPPSTSQTSSLSPPSPSPGPEAAPAANHLTADEEPDDDDELMHARKTLEVLSPEAYRAAMRWAKAAMPTASHDAHQIAAARHVREVAA